MTLRDVLLLGHILVFGIWLGTDIATFLISRKVLDRTIDLTSRGALAGAMTGIEVIARLCLPTMLALGVALAVDNGLIDLPRWLVGGVFVPTVVWLGLIWKVHISSGDAELASALAMVDLVVRSAVCLTLWAVSIVSLAGDAGPIYAPYLAAKALLFAVIMTSGIAIRFALRPFAAAFGALVTNGSTDERERRLSSSLRVAQPLVGVIWLCLVGASLLAVVKALPWQ